MAVIEWPGSQSLTQENSGRFDTRYPGGVQPYRAPWSSRKKGRVLSISKRQCSRAPSPASDVSSAVSPHRRSIGTTRTRRARKISLSSGKTSLFSTSRSPCMSLKVDEMKTRTTLHDRYLSRASTLARSTRSALGHTTRSGNHWTRCSRHSSSFMSRRSSASRARSARTAARVGLTRAAAARTLCRRRRILDDDDDDEDDEDEEGSVSPPVPPPILFSFVSPCSSVSSALEAAPSRPATTGDDGAFPSPPPCCCCCFFFFWFVAAFGDGENGCFFLNAFLSSGKLIWFDPSSSICAKSSSWVAASTMTPRRASPSKSSCRVSTPLLSMSNILKRSTMRWWFLARCRFTSDTTSATAASESSISSSSSSSSSFFFSFLPLPPPSVPSPSSPELVCFSDISRRRRSAAPPVSPSAALHVDSCLRRARRRFRSRL